MYPFALPLSTLFRIGLLAILVSPAYAHQGEEASWYKDEVTAAHACMAASEAHGYGPWCYGIAGIVTAACPSHPDFPNFTNASRYHFYTIYPEWTGKHEFYYCLKDAVCPTATPPYTLTADGRCVQDTHYRLVLHAMGDANATQGEVEPGKALGLRAVVYDATNQPVAGIKLDIKAEVVANSGGHAHHDSDRPKGTVPETGVTTAGGFDFSFTAPVVAGDHTVTVACGGCEGVGSFGVEVGVRGLTQIPDTSLYKRIVPNRDKYHPSNHYLQRLALYRLTAFASLYRMRYPDDPILYLNDASLERGGVFDLNRNWRPMHFEHCHGAAIDIRANGAEGALNISNNSDPKIRQIQSIADIVGTDAVWEVPKRKDLATGKYVDLWDYRHFHTRLIGSEGLQCP